MATDQSAGLWMENFRCHVSRGLDLSLPGSAMGFSPFVFKVPFSHWLISFVLAIIDILFLITCEGQGTGTGLN